MNLLIEVQM